MARSRARAEQGRSRTMDRQKKKPARNGAGRLLAALADTANITRATKAAGVGRRTVYRRRDADPAFAEQMADAIDEATDALELEARRRAKDGVERPVFQKGVEVG